MRKQKRTFIHILLIVALLVGQVAPGVMLTSIVYAGPSSPSSPEQPDQPDQPDEPDQPTQPDEPEQPDQPDQPTQPGTEEETTTQETPPATTEQTTTNPSDTTTQTTPSPETSNTGHDSEGGNVNQETSIETGDANAVGGINTAVNTNIVTNEPTNNAPGISVKNTGNGTNSDNDASIYDEASVTTTQENSASISNDATMGANTGKNTVKENTGGSNSIDTGDANTALTVVNQANTNIAGADVVEFNVVDDHVGDIVLDFTNPCANNECIASSPLYLANANNGNNSENTIDQSGMYEEGTFQYNDAVIENDIILGSNTGDNKIKDNTNGDIELETGDANVSANVINFANTNIAGNVILGIVNIFGNLIGDLIIPESQLPENYGTYLANTDNGSASDNFINIDQAVLDQMTQQNSAIIDNNLDLYAETGANNIKDNTNGNTEVETGNANILAQILNIANTNIIGGDWWIVLVNDAGNWFGKIIGGQEGQNFAGSEGTQFTQSPGGALTAQNLGNGSYSDNDIQSQNQQTNTTVQENTASITNNIQLSANTGGNKVSGNTGGDIAVDTGDANIVANVVNFLNNNIIGGRIYLTVVNVFGSWIGDIVPPGMTKENAQSEETNNNNEEIARGGTAESSSDGNTSNQDEDNEEQSAVDIDETGGSVLASIMNNVPKIQSGVSLTAPFISNLDTESDSPAMIKSEAKGKRIIRFNLAPFIVALALISMVYSGKRVLPLIITRFKKAE